MNLQMIVQPLAELASLSYQERYVIGGTADEYVLDVELLENVDGIQYWIERPEHGIALTDEQRVALWDLFSYIKSHSGEALSATSREEGSAIIRDSEVWATLRAKAAATLETFGGESAVLADIFQ